MTDPYQSWLDQQRAATPSDRLVDRVMERLAREPGRTRSATRPTLTRVLDWVSTHRLAQAACLAAGCALAALRLITGLQFILSY